MREIYIGTMIKISKVIRNKRSIYVDKCFSCGRVVETPKNCGNVCPICNGYLGTHLFVKNLIDLSDTVFKDYPNDSYLFDIKTVDNSTYIIPVSRNLIFNKYYKDDVTNIIEINSVSSSPNTININKAFDEFHSLYNKYLDAAKKVYNNDDTSLNINVDLIYGIVTSDKKL